MKKRYLREDERWREKANHGSDREKQPCSKVTSDQPHSSYNVLGMLPRHLSKHRTYIMSCSHLMLHRSTVFILMGSVFMLLVFMVIFTLIGLKYVMPFFGFICILFSLSHSQCIYSIIPHQFLIQRNFISV